MDKTLKWKAILGIVLIVISILTNWYFIWGIFFAFWVFTDIKSGFTHLFEPVYKRENPFLYWIIILLWIFLGVYSLLYYSESKLINQISTFNSIDNKEYDKNSYLKNERYFLGYETQLSGIDKKDKEFINELWNLFNRNYGGNLPSNRSNQNIYVIYCDFNSDSNSFSKVLIGHQVTKIDKTSSELNSVTVPENEFYCFESGSNSENFISTQWDEVTNTIELQENSFAVEKYVFDYTGQLIKSELQIQK